MSHAADTALLVAAHKASDVLKAFLKYADMIEAAGGLHKLKGQELAIQLADNLLANRGPIRQLVFEPLAEAIRMKAS